MGIGLGFWVLGTGIGIGTGLGSGLSILDEDFACDLPPLLLLLLGFCGNFKYKLQCFYGYKCLFVIFYTLCSTGPPSSSSS